MNNKESVIEFSKVKQRIKEAIEDKFEILDFKESVTLLDGFVNSPYSKTQPTTELFGGPFVPMVMLVGNETGRVYFFAYNLLIK